MARITKTYFDGILESHKFPPDVCSIIQNAISAIHKAEKTLLGGFTAKQSNWTTCQLDRTKLFDVATLIENVMRIGKEEHQETYEEFFTMIVDLIDAIWYAQENRKRIFFPKYKAIVSMITNELKADVNKRPGQFWYQGELFIRPMPQHESSNEF